MKINIKNISNNEIPAYENDGDAGADIRADFSRISPTNLLKVYGDSEILFANDVQKKVLLRLEPGSRALIPTGLFVNFPKGYEIQIRPRSGLALKSGLTVLNTPGTIDSGFRGELQIILINLSKETQWIEDGERIAQMVGNKVEKIEFNKVDDINDGIDRGGGFGSTG